MLDPAGPNDLVLVASVEPRRTGTVGGPGIGGLAQLLFTAGDISPDGRHVALRTYTDVYEWAVPTGGDLAQAFSSEPAITPLPPTQQGEGLAYDRSGAALLTSSEGVDAPVHRLPRQAVPNGAAGVEGGSGDPSGAPVAPLGADSSTTRRPLLYLLAPVALLLTLVAVRRRVAR